MKKTSSLQITNFNKLLSKFNLSVITIDTDWAPDFIIMRVVELLVKKNIKATWFVTHNSPVVDVLKDHKEIFEVGIHPNFFENSTQGKNNKEIIENLLTFATDAKSIRTHSLYQSLNLLDFISHNYPQITIDSSLLMKKSPFLTPHNLYFHSGSMMTRFPIFWQDDIESSEKIPTWNLEESIYHVKGLKVFNFHPIHLWINTFNIDQYLKLKKEIPDINNSKQKDLDKFVNKGNGAFRFFEKLLNHISKVQDHTYTITELNDKYQKFFFSDTIV